MVTETDQTEIIFSDEVSQLITNAEKYSKIRSLILDTEVTCTDLQVLCDQSFFRKLEYLLFYDLQCNELPADFSKLLALEKLIINSEELDHFPSVLLSLPKLQHLQLDLSEYKTFTAAIPSSCRLEELEFQSTPVDNLGNLTKITTLRKVGIISEEELKVKNDKIEMVYH